MTSPIQDVLHTLSKHGAVVQEALLDIVSVNDRTPGATIMALRQASALRPVGDDGYRLHPRLREYLQDHLQLFPAFQSLAEISSKIMQLSTLWNEIELNWHSTDEQMKQNLNEAFKVTGYDIADIMERNVLFLQTLISTRFGNVTSLEAKKSQNRYYHGQAATIQTDLIRLWNTCNRIEQEASLKGALQAPFLRKVLIGRIVDWQQVISEIHAEIRKEFFRMREINQDHKLLARMNMMLRQQPAWDGIDVELEGDVPDFLCNTSMPKFVSHVDPYDNDRSMVSEMVDIAKDFPMQKPPPAPAAPPVRYKRVQSVNKPIVKPPETLALKRLMTAVLASASGVSIVAHHSADKDAQTMSLNVWLMFATVGLRSYDLDVKLVRNPPRPGERFSHSFCDAIAKAKQTDLLAMAPAEALA